MKFNYLISIVIIIGILVLLFFPEPEINFLAYLSAALFFIIIIFLIIKYGGKNDI